MSIKRFGQVTKFGVNSSPSSQIPALRAINGTAVTEGDGGTGVGSIFWPAVGVGYYSQSPTTERGYPILELIVDPSEIAGHDVVKGLVDLGFIDVEWNDAFSAPVSIYFHLCLVPVDVTDATALEYDDSLNLAWSQPFGALGVDIETTPSATFVVTQEVFDNIDDNASSGAPVFYPIDLTDACRHAADLGLTKIQFQMRPSWAKPSGTTGRRAIFFHSSRANPTQPHDTVEIRSTPPVSFYGLLPDGSVDFGSYYDSTIADRAAKVQTGAPSPGGTGPVKVVAAVNTTRSELPNVAIIRDGAFAEAPTRPTGSCILKGIAVFDDDSTAPAKGLDDADFRITPVTLFELTRYQVFRTPAFSTENSTPLTTVAGNAYGRYDTPETFVMPDTRYGFEIFPEWWLDTIPSGQSLVVRAVGDGRPAGYTTAAAERHQMTHYQGLFDGGVTLDRTLPDDARWRNCWDATVQQLTSAAFVETVDLSPGGAIDRTHLPVSDVRKFDVGTVIVVVNTDLDVEYAIVRGTLAYNHATPSHRDCLILDRELATAFSTDALVVSGLYLGTLGPLQRRFLAALAQENQAYADLTEAFASATGTVKFFNQTTGDNELRTYTQTSARLTFAPGEKLVNRYEANDLAIVNETNSWKQVFFRLKPEEGAQQQEQLARVRAIRLSSK